MRLDGLPVEVQGLVRLAHPVLQAGIAQQGAEVARRLLQALLVLLLGLGQLPVSPRTIGPRPRTIRRPASPRGKELGSFLPLARPARCEPCPAWRRWHSRGGGGSPPDWPPAPNPEAAHAARQIASHPATPTVHIGSLPDFLRICTSCASGQTPSNESAFGQSILQLNWKIGRICRSRRVCGLVW